MTQDTPASPRSAAVRAEAAAWVARLHSSSRSRALEAGLQRWLKADPAHAHAFELATEAWEIAGSVPRLVRSGAAGRGTLVRRRWRFAHTGLAAAAALAAIAIGLLLYREFAEPVVLTAVGEQRILTLSDGSRVFMNTDTRLLVQEEHARRYVRLDSGEALFEVAKDPQRPFVVSAGDREVVALGTSFVVRREARLLSVTLVEGKVAISAASQSSAAAAQLQTRAVPSFDSGTVLAPGQRLTFADHEPPRLDLPQVENVMAWRRGEVILDDARLEDAAAEMNRYSTVKLVIDGAQVGDLRVSGIFRVGDSARFAQAVGETYHLSVERSRQQIVISGTAP